MFNKVDLKIDQPILNMIQKELKINRISNTVSSKQTVRYNYDNTGLFISFFNQSWYSLQLRKIGTSH